MTLLQRIRTPFSEATAGEPAWSQPAQRHVGDVLRERREDLGLDLDEIGAMLRIRPAYLAALEQGRSHDLPGPAYAIGFVRAYADFLGLDTEQVLGRFRGEAAGVTARPDLALPVPLGERSLPGRALVLVAMIVTLCGYGIWYYLTTDNRNRPERVAACRRNCGHRPRRSWSRRRRPSRRSPNLAQPTPPPAIGGPAAARPGSSAHGGAADAAQPQFCRHPCSRRRRNRPRRLRLLRPPRLHRRRRLRRRLRQQRSQPPRRLLATAAPGPIPTAASKVSIRALADCWIQIRAPDQSIVFSRILKSGEVYNVPARQGLWLRTGNAGVLEIAVDGKTVPSIGGIGTLRRDVALDPAELVAGKAVHG